MLGEVVKDSERCLRGTPITIGVSCSERSSSDLFLCSNNQENRDARTIETMIFIVRAVRHERNRASHGVVADNEIHGVVVDRYIVSQKVSLRWTNPIMKTRVA